MKTLMISLSEDQRFELLKLEMELLHSSIDKYDTQITNMRNWFISVWTGAVGAALVADVPIFFVLGSSLAIFCWLLEGTVRRKRWYKYVTRYRTLNQALNGGEFDFSDVSIYDLSNKFLPDITRAKLKHLEIVYPPTFRKAFFKLEAMMLYGFFCAGGIVLWVIAQN